MAGGGGGGFGFSARRSQDDYRNMTPEEYAAFTRSSRWRGHPRSGFGKLFNRKFRDQAEELYGGYGDERYNRYLDALNPETASAVNNFYNGGVTSGGMANMDPSNPLRVQGADYNPYSNININRYDHLDKKENPADKLYADLIRAQTKDYLTRFAPVEQWMANQITNTGTRALGGDLQRTRESVLGATSNVEGQQKRAMSRMGLNYTPQSADNQSTVGTLVGGLNDTRMRDVDRRQAMLSGNLGALSQKARGNVS